MFFEKEKYYKYINTIEKMNTTIYVILIILGFITGIAGGLLGIILGTGIGFLLGNVYTFSSKIKIQEMKWKMDIHYELMNKKNENKI